MTEIKPDQLARSNARLGAELSEVRLLLQELEVLERRQKSATDTISGMKEMAEDLISKMTDTRTVFMSILGILGSDPAVLSQLLDVASPDVLEASLRSARALMAKLQNIISKIQQEQEKSET